MKLLHRYLLLELAQDALLTLVAVMAFYFLVAMALTLGTSRAENLPIEVILEYTIYQAISNLYLTLPLTILTATIFTYGRLSAEGEFTALRAAGIHPYQALMPALVMGALFTFTLAWLQSDITPSAHYRTRTELDTDVLRNLESLLRRSDKRVQDQRWTASWEELAQNEQGQIILKDLTVIRLDKDRNPETTLRAEHARPVLDDVNKSLTLDLQEVRITEKEQAWPTRMVRMSISLDLDSLSSRSNRNKRIDDRTYEELITRWQRSDRRAAELAVAALSETSEAARERRVLSENFAKDARKERTEYNMRVAYAFAPLIFSLLGTALGLRRAWGNRALVFLAGFLILIGVYYPLMMLGRTLGRAGQLPPELSLWVANALMLGLGLWLFRRVVRT